MDVVPPRIELKPFPPDADELEVRWWDAIEAGDVLQANEVYSSSSSSSSSNDHNHDSVNNLVTAVRSTSRLKTITSRAAYSDAITPLLLAADRGHAEMVRYMLQVGADPIATSPVSLPEHARCEADDADVCSWLVPLTPLDRAMERGHVQVIEELIVWAWTVHRPELLSDVNDAAGGAGGGGEGLSFLNNSKGGLEGGWGLHHAHDPPWVRLMAGQTSIIHTTRQACLSFNSPTVLFIISLTNSRTTSPPPVMKPQLKSKRTERVRERVCACEWNEDHPGCWTTTTPVGDAALITTTMTTTTKTTGRGGKI